MTNAILVMAPVASNISFGRNSDPMLFATTQFNKLQFAQRVSLNHAAKTRPALPRRIQCAAFTVRRTESASDSL